MRGFCAIIFGMSESKKVKNADDFLVMRSGKGSGFGLKSKKAYKKGDEIIEYVGIKYRDKEVEENTTKYLFELENGFTIDGSPRWNIARYINHSCAPNAETEIQGSRVFVIAIKAIPPGEEITYDYGKEYFNEFIKPMGCKCKKCLKKK